MTTVPDPTLVFPVPEEDDENLDKFTGSPEMPGTIKPIWPGTYYRYIQGQWVWNEFMDDYWIAVGIFEHMEQEAPWRGAILTGHMKLLEELDHIKQFGDFQ